jgi:hypothetical protein
MSLNTFRKRVLKDVHFFIISQQSSLKPQHSILQSNVYTPYLDDRQHFYPVSSNLLTTCNKGKACDHTVIFIESESFLFDTCRLAQLVFIAGARL